MNFMSMSINRYSHQACVVFGHSYHAFYIYPVYHSWDCEILKIYPYPLVGRVGIRMSRCLFQGAPRTISEIPELPLARSPPVCTLLQILFMQLSEEKFRTTTGQQRGNWGDARYEDT